MSMCWVDNYTDGQTDRQTLSDQRFPLEDAANQAVTGNWTDNGNVQQHVTWLWGLPRDSQLQTWEECWLPVLKSESLALPSQSCSTCCCSIHTPCREHDPLHLACMTLHQSHGQHTPCLNHTHSPCYVSRWTIFLQQAGWLYKWPSMYADDAIQYVLSPLCSVCCAYTSAELGWYLADVGTFTHLSVNLLSYWYIAWFYIFLVIFIFFYDWR